MALDNGKALMIPRKIGMWDQLVEEEVSISKFLTSINMLSPLSKKINVSLPDAPQSYFCTYISESFENLGTTRNWYIIDTKNEHSCTWIEDHNSLFKTPEDRTKVEIWDAATAPLLEDIMKIFLYKFPADGDSLNIAIVKNSPDSPPSLCEYSIQYFGFDFSNTDYKIPTSFEELKSQPSSDELKKVKLTLNIILEAVFICEFTYNKFYSVEGTPFRAMLDEIVFKYTQSLPERIFEYSKKFLSGGII